MSERDDDLELQALQRQLDDAFETTRPRRGFDDELWLRLQARRPIWERVRDWVSGLGGSVREAPAIPLTAVAVLLVVVVGVGIISSSGLHFGGNSLSTAQSGTNPAADGAQYGRLPSPSLHPGLLDPTAPGAVAFGPTVPNGSTATSNFYYGPATLSWTGQFPAELMRAPVLRYFEPGSVQADQFAASLGGSNNKQVRQVNGFIGTYIGADFTVSVRASIPQLPREPFYLLKPSNPAAQAGDPSAAATAFLARYSLVPAWPNTVTVQQTGDQNRVQFLRQFQLPGGGLAYLIDWNGERYGAEVDFKGGQLLEAGGPLPISLEPVVYRLISNDQAMRAALGSPPATSATITPTPVVALTQVELVYALAVANGQGFYEPAYLFSGSFQYNGQTLVKRVLVPLVDPSLRS